MTGKARNDFGHDEPSYRGSDFVPLDAMEIDLEKYPQLTEFRYLKKRMTETSRRLRKSSRTLDPFRPPLSPRT